MTVINTNVGALTSRTYAVQANNRMQTSMERLSSGLRINSAADDAAGLAVANKMESQLRGMNQAIRNSQDGISLVQTAESGMSEISNMVIRMRELAVQMNNGVYTDSDRTNAQLEITALLAEVDKIATNSAFNQVKILDGTYSKDIRAGNTNPEVINVTIDRMNSDSLGGVLVTAGVVNASRTAETAATGASLGDIESTTVINATESAKVTVNNAALSSQIRDFANTVSGSYSLAGADSSKFSIDETTGVITANTRLSFEDPSSTATSNAYTLEVTYTDGTKSFKDNVTLNITDLNSTDTTGTTTLSVTEGSAVTINGTASTSVGLSEAFREFKGTDTGGSFSLSGTDAGDFSIDTDGVITVNSSLTQGLNFENASGGGAATNAYTFNAIYTKADSTTFTESITLNVTDVTGTADGVTALGTSGVTTGTASGFAATETYTLSGASATQAYGTAEASEAFQAFVANNAGGTYSIAATGANTSGVYSIDASNGTITMAGGSAASAATATLNVTYTVGSSSYTDTGTHVIVNGSAAQSWTSGTSGAGAMAISMDLNSDDADLTHTIGTASTAFGDLGQFANSVSSATFSITAVTVPTGGSSAEVSVSSAGVLTIDQGAITGSNYVITLQADDGTDTMVQTVTLTVNDATSPTTGTATLSSDGGAVTVSTSSSSAVTRTDSKMTVDEGREANIAAAGTSGVTTQAFKDFVSANANGTYTLSGTDASSFTVDTDGLIKSTGLMDYEAKTSYTFSVTYTSGNDSIKDDITLTVNDNTADNGDHIENVNISTQAGAATAVTILDTAINQISASQAKLGAIQNRLNHNIDNLSMASMLTETARGRIVDADFARETSELSKQQILAQAATSMLAQANQSKQSVLALLQ